MILMRKHLVTLTLLLCSLGMHAQVRLSNDWDGTFAYDAAILAQAFIDVLGYDSLQNLMLPNFEYPIQHPIAHVEFYPNGEVKDIPFMYYKRKRYGGKRLFMNLKRAIAKRGHKFILLVYDPCSPVDLLYWKNRVEEENMAVMGVPIFYKSLIPLKQHTLKGEEFKNYIQSQIDYWLSKEKEILYAFPEETGSKSPD